MNDSDKNPFRHINVQVTNENIQVMVDGFDLDADGRSSREVNITSFALNSHSLNLEIKQQLVNDPIWSRPTKVAIYSNESTVAFCNVKISPIHR
jgi:hypothetical protein